MADEINPIPTETIEPTAVTPVKEKEEKKFSQSELDKVVAERLSREKASTKKIIDEFSTEKTNLETTLKTYEDQIEKILAPQLEDIPEEFQSLFNKLTLLEKIEWLASRQSKTEKKGIPATPKPKEAETKPIKKIGTFI